MRTKNFDPRGLKRDRLVASIFAAEGMESTVNAEPLESADSLAAVAAFEFESKHGYAPSREQLAAAIFDSATDGGAFSEVAGHMLRLASDPEAIFPAWTFRGNLTGNHTTTRHHGIYDPIRMSHRPSGSQVNRSEVNVAQSVSFQGIPLAALISIDAEELINFDHSNGFAGQLQAIAQAPGVNAHEAAFSLLKLAETGDNQSAWNSENSHPTTPLNAGSLAASYARLRSRQSADGIHLNYEPDVLLVAPEQKTAALAILDAMPELGLEVIDDPRVTEVRHPVTGATLTETAGTWYLLDSDKAVMFDWIREPRTGQNAHRGENGEYVIDYHVSGSLTAAMGDTRAIERNIP